jgi:hypothetical protein
MMVYVIVEQGLVPVGATVMVTMLVARGIIDVDPSVPMLVKQGIVMVRVGDHNADPEGDWRADERPVC